MYGKSSAAILVFDRLSTTFPYKVRTEIAIIECSPHSDALYRYVREIFDRHFGLRPITSTFFIDSPYKNCDFTMFPTLTYTV